MRRPAARIGDNHTCPVHDDGPVIATCSPNVIIGGKNAARATDLCDCGSTSDMIVTGSRSVFINGLPAARLGDKTNHGGQIVEGLPSVLIGDDTVDFGAAGIVPAVSSTCLGAAARNSAPFVRP